MIFFNKLIDLNLKYKYAWLYKLLITWSRRELYLGWYPDYETPKFWLTVRVGKQ